MSRKDRPRPLARSAALLALALGSATLLVAQACLPDLDAFPPPPDAGDTVTSVQSFCGDGVIETNDDGSDAGESCDPGDASTAGCEGCRLRCTGTIDPSTGHCYFWADPTSDFNRAATACVAARAHLVTFASEAEARLADTLPGADAGYWVGLILRGDKRGFVPALDFKEPGWPDPANGSTCRGCFAVGADDAGAFPGEEEGADGQCLVTESGAWRTVPCQGPKVRSVLCEREPIGERLYPCGGLLCTNLFVTAGKKSYVLWPSAVSAREAAEACTRTYDGGSLVTFDSAEEREQLVREIVQRLQDPNERSIEMWIGLSADGGAPVWDDGADAAGRPAPWGEDQPRSDGRAFLRIDDDRFDTQLARTDEDASAETRRVFVCQRPAL